MRRRRVVLSIVLAAAVTGCGAGEPASEAAPPPADPLALVGRWHVDLPDQPEAAAVSFGERLLLFLDCGVMDGSWRADGQQGLFVGHVSGGDDSCFRGGGPPATGWLQAAGRFAVEGDTPVLLDDAGRRVAVLRPGAEPTVGPNRDRASYEAPPSPPAELRAGGEQPEALPAGADPATPATLTGRWVPADLTPSTRAHLAFASDGSWTGSDGCNGVGGRFALGDGGRLLAVSGGSTLMGCPGAPVAGWLSQAARAGLVEDRLVLYDAGGAPVGTLRAGGG